MDDGNHKLTLSEAAGCFLADIASDKREASQPEVYRFIRWFGRERPLADVSAPEVENYAERLSSSDTDYGEKLRLLRAFLSHARKEGWCEINLATHVKARKGKTRVQSTAKGESVEPTALTKEGYTEMETELSALKGRRSGAIDEVRKAAADKDFRENAPLEAARQQHGQLVGRIKELEGILKTAVIVSDKQEAALKAKISVGDKVVLQDAASGEELRYMIVSPKEVDPAKARISNLSPIGKAVVGHSIGDTVEVSVPSGKLRYQIKNVER